MFGHMGVKLVYFRINCTGFWFTDRILNHRYTEYGIEWIKWSRLNNTMAYYSIHEAGNVTPKPGEYLFPSLGFCDVLEGYHDNLDVHNNKYKTICEISPHILYQYVFLVLWFVFVIGVTASLIGFLCQVVHIVMLNMTAWFRSDAKKMDLYHGCGHLTFRELNYMDIIRMKNHLMFNEVLALVRQQGEVYLDDDSL